MFKSRKGALLFAALIVFGAISMVGTEESGGTLTDASDDIARQRADLEAEMARENALTDEADEEQVDDEDDLEGWDDSDEDYLSEDELIDDTQGESTEPMTDTEPGDDGDGDGEAFEEFLVTGD